MEIRVTMAPAIDDLTTALELLRQLKELAAQKDPSMADSLAYGIRYRLKRMTEVKAG